MDYFDYLMLMNHSKSDGWAAFEKKEPIVSTKKLVAFYLPQFHPIPENNLNWGAGFTEWRNVTRALPLFEGHIQPRHPADLGFYDLQSVDVLRTQAELARNYGVDGFAFYYYWFDSKVLLEAPLENLFKNPDIDMSYCVFWANENWTKSWDGLEKEILVRQNHSAEDDIRFIAHVSKYFSDPRYIRYRGSPILLMYRPQLLPDARKTAERWRSWCQTNGVAIPYLISAQALGAHQDPAENGFDASIEFPPHQGSACDAKKLQRPSVLKRFSSRTDFGVVEYQSAVNAWSHRNPCDYKLFKCAFPNWDNTPRRVNSHATIFGWSTPDLYRQWLVNCLAIADEEDFVFINAWNEWAEGAFLEPDLFWGHAYLAATWEALAANSGGRE
jgi:O-antigen biosynthesis protein